MNKFRANTSRSFGGLKSYPFCSHFSYRKFLSEFVFSFFDRTEAETTALELFLRKRLVREDMHINLTINVIGN